MTSRRRLTRPLAPALVLACAALAWPAASSAAVACPNASIMPTSSSLSQARAATLCLINRERTSRGLPRLSASRRLLGAAKSYSRLMVRQGFFGHVSPGGSTLISRIRHHTTYLHGSRSWSLGENIAWGSGALATPARTVTAWMHSSAHRANILASRFRQIGIGIAVGAPRPTHGFAAATYTADFGRRS